jgi:hypothetical protein
MTDKDIEDWENEYAAPKFRDGKFIGIAKQCGCFHPLSLIDVFDPLSGGEIEMPANEVVRRRQELFLVHLDQEATARNFVASYSPIKLTTHGKEPFDLVVIRLKNRKALKLTREHGVFVWPGVMKRALDVLLSDKLFDRKGELINIESISSEFIEDEVVNFETNPNFSRDKQEEAPLEHVIFAAGVAVGDLAWRNRFRPFLGQILWKDLSVKNSCSGSTKQEFSVIKPKNSWLEFSMK